MAAAIQASDKEGAKCEERIARITARHDKEMADLREDFDRLRAVVQRLIPLVPADVQAQLWSVMWSRNDDSPNALTGGTTAPLEELFDTTSPEVTSTCGSASATCACSSPSAWSSSCSRSAGSSGGSTSGPTTTPPTSTPPRSRTLAQQELIDRLALTVDEAISQGAAVQTPEEIAEEVPAAEVSPSTEEGDRGEQGPPGLQAHQA